MGPRKSRQSSAFVVALLLVRTVAFTEGCLPRKGTLGGQCDSNGCNTYCNDGSRCESSTNTCVGNPTFSGPPSGCNFNGSDARCAPGQTAYQCLGQTTPESESGVPGCHWVSTDISGNAIFCCTPTCAVYASRCGAPSTTYICSGPARPEDADPSIECITRLSYWGISQYCCAEPDTCFEFLDLQSDCPDEELVFCTGTATPSPGTTCVTSASDAAGSAVRAYCCVRLASNAGDAG